MTAIGVCAARLTFSPFFWMDARDDLPRVVRAGRHIARSRRYIRNYGAEIEPADLVAEVETQAGRGDGWVKLVGSEYTPETAADKDDADKEAPKKAKGGRSGNPAKRAIEQKQWEARQSGESDDLAGNDVDFQLPDELKGLLPPGSR